MKTVEIPEKEWGTFFEDFFRSHQGSLISIEMLDAGGSKIEVSRDMPLDRIVYDPRADACNNVISIGVSEPGKRAIEHVILDPIHVIVRETGEHKKRLEIAAENGTTHVTFHSGKLPETVANAEEGFTGRSAKESFL